MCSRNVIGVGSIRTMNHGKQDHVIGLVEHHKNGQIEMYLHPL